MEAFQKTTGWALILRGILFGLFGFLIIFLETSGLYGPMFYLGILFLVSGSLYILISILLRGKSSAWLYGLFWGAIDIVIGTYIWFNMESATTYFTIIIGAFATLMGISILIAAFFVKGIRMLLVINSVVSISFGLLILFNPFPAKFLYFLIGLFALLFGLFITYCGIMVMRIGNKMLEPIDLKKLDENEQ